MLLFIIQIVSFLAGMGLTLWTIDQALRAFVLPRSDRAFLTVTTFRVIAALQRLQFKPHTRFAQRDRVVAMLSPRAMFTLPLVWLSLIIIGYAAMYWAISAPAPPRSTRNRPWRKASCASCRRSPPISAIRKPRVARRRISRPCSSRK